MERKSFQIIIYGILSFIQFFVYTPRTLGQEIDRRSCSQGHQLSEELNKTYLGIINNHQKLFYGQLNKNTNQKDFSNLKEFCLKVETLKENWKVNPLYKKNDIHEIFPLRIGKRVFKTKIEIGSSGQVFVSFLEKILGTGADKVVEEFFAYNGLEKSLEKSASLRLHDKLKNDPKAIVRFQEEQRILRKINQSKDDKTGIVGLMDFQNWAIFLEPYENEFFDPISMDRKKWHEAELPSREIYSILLQASKGMKTLHDVGIVHADIKPENILIRKKHLIDSRTGRPSYKGVLTDFGFSFFIDEVGVTVPLKTVGTPFYWAPEVNERTTSKMSILEQQDISPKRDVYAMAVTTAIATKEYRFTPWVWGRECSKLKFNLSYLNCIQGYLKKKIKKVMTDPDATPLQMLLARGLNPNPYKRISAKNWTKALEAIIKLNDLPAKENTLTFKELADVGKKFKKFRGDYEINDAIEELQLIDAKPGEYLLIPKRVGLESPAQYKLQIALYNFNRQLETEDLTVDFQNPELALKKLIFSIQMYKALNERDEQL